jgi:hypothetical protein
MFGLKGNEVTGGWRNYIMRSFVNCTLHPVYEVASESSRTVIVVTALVKEDVRGGQGHTLKAYCISLPRDTAL